MLGVLTTLAASIFHVGMEFFERGDHRLHDRRREGEHVHGKGAGEARLLFGAWTRKYPSRPS